MSRAHIGQLLSRMGRLTQHDIHEILADQIVTHRPFGQIALAWGLCEPEHIWKAWSRQLADGPDYIDLDLIGVDAQAVAWLPPDLAWRLNAIPVRMLEDHMVIAVCPDTPPEVADELRGVSNEKVHLVYADDEQIQRALETYYPVAPGDLE